MSPETWRQHWVHEKCQVALRLSQGEAGGSYAEAAILVCAALSALAAELWKGVGIDRSRFIELLVRLGPQAHFCRTISVLLLVQHLRNDARELEAETLSHTFLVPNTARVITGPEVDNGEDDILNICPQLELKELRSFSYTSVLYGEIRSSYAHEYRPGEQADSWPMTMLPDQRVSYINRLADDLKMKRLIHFHLEWLAHLPVELAMVVDGLAPTLPQTTPSIWWVQGG